MDDTLERDIYHRLGGIEAKIDDFRAVREIASQADATANQALQLSKRNEAEIQEMRTETSNNRRWLISAIVGGILSMASVVVAIIALLI